MDPKKALEPLEKAGIALPVSATTLAIIGLVVAALLVAVPVAWKLWKKRKEALPPAVALPGNAAGVAPSIAPSQLRKAWKRFLAPLPRIYRRSILNFEHFVVLGESGAGKSTVIDTFTDWRRQAKQFLGSQAFDPDLQVYLGSEVVVTEIPSKVLADHGPRCRTALKRLWKPLYSKRSPAVVVVVDMVELGQRTPDAIVDLAERIRGKVNLLSSIRKRALELRIVLTHLDAFDGYLKFAEFCRDEKIPLRIPLVQTEPEPDTRQQLDTWLDRARGHLARALVRKGSEDFRKVIGFLRNAPVIPGPLAQFVDVMFAKEALSITPRLGGVYLSAPVAGEPNPLQGAAESGPGPDPRIRHLVAATLAASMTLTYLTIAFFTQRARYEAASAALVDYKPSMVGFEAEERRREAITAFASRARGLTETKPDFFANARVRIRAAASERIRSDLLVPNLRKVAQNGAIKEKEMPLPWRRALFYLALIHGNASDGMHILNPERLEIWSKMTELPPEIIRDYLVMTDVSALDPISFELSQHGVDARDGLAFWTSFIRELERAIDGGIVNRAELKALQTRAADVAESLDRFEHDELAASILAGLDEAASLGPARREVVDLEVTYRSMFQEYLADVAAAHVFGQREPTRAIFRAVRGANLDAPKVTLLSELDDRLTAMYAAPIDAVAPQPIVLKLAGVEYGFDTKRWAELVRDSQANEMVAQFLRPRNGDTSIFFAPGRDQELRPVEWNPTNDGSAIFTGTAGIEGRLTRTAYDKFIRDPVTRLGPALGPSKISEEHKRGLDELVKDQVRRYGVEYKTQLLRFYKSFGISTPSPEALRVALSQMVADQSPFSTFIAAVDRQVDVQLDSPLLDPMRLELAEFKNFHKIVDAASGSAEIGKYKAILAQLLLDLGPPSDAAPGAVVPASAGGPIAGDTLEAALAQPGRLVLADIRGDKGSYQTLVARWLASVQLPPSQQGPFLAPVEQLARLGRHDIEVVVQRVWERDLLPDMVRLAQKFPFDPTSPEDATPKDIDPLLNPTSGKVFDVFRRYFEPISEVPDGGAFRPRASLRGHLTVPANLYSVTNAAAALSSRLYDGKGHANPLSLKIATVPFEHGTNPRTALTVVYLTIGEATIFNFNQKPGVSTIRFDWTREQVSQVGIQLTDLDAHENLFPDPIATPSSHWSVLRLLGAGQATAVKQPPDGALYTWDIRHRRDGTDKTPARFVVIGNLAEMFSLGHLSKPPAARLGTN